MAVELPGPQRERYARQAALPDLGVDAQVALIGASVLVVGAGALGCPAAAYLAAAGVPAGAVGGVIGSLLALEAIKAIAAVGRPLRGRMLLLDGLEGTMGERRAGSCGACFGARTGATS